MSEDLVQQAGFPFGRYSYLRLGATTLNQLSQSRLIKGRIPADAKQRKPDGLILLPKGGIKAVVEIKSPSELVANKVPSVIETYSPIARAIDGCNLLILTDGQTSYWINPHTENVIQHEGSDLRVLFDPKAVSSCTLTQEDEAHLLTLIDLADQTISPGNDVLRESPILDPTPLAEKVWQKIWITTGKEPEKCLYNVVEIFVFKFLSDIGVLRGNRSFTETVKYIAESNDDALDHYANMVRPRIRELFPAGDDKTTIINGTIFVNEKGEPNHAQSSLFVQVLEDFQEFDNLNGSMKNIDRQFKTRLFESFLRQSAGIKALGQYFTPRNVVQTMVRMSGADKLPDGARIADPFCGVGGFILETIAEFPSLYNQFVPKNKKIAPKIQFRGFDKGSDEKDDERTIILAKANMLIYFSELLTQYNDEDYLKEFAKSAFNETFHLLRDNLGTFALMDEEPFDLILTNPPYVTSGSASLRKSIEHRGLGDFYANSGRGTEALAMEWIINNLKPGGRSLVVVPDGLMNQKKVLDSIKDRCVVDSITALPSRTFFSTPKKTYILEFTKKTDLLQTQTDPVLMYVVSEVGESRDARRKPIKENDLTTLETVHKYFMVDKQRFTPNDPRAKVLRWEDFDSLTQWLVERQWSPEERKDLQLEEERSEVDEQGFVEMVATTLEDLQAYLQEVGNEKP
ncbi:N-6 DNA methylase [Corynebacterium sp. P5848]|uniref:HsdM family class I SAM-dependent methyltransferase n=1 Tax=Corynebacterium marambiense TaxID=2765364 RepID=UPI002260E469|nr:N-6 DNA methylase [Corynebacterium marambiense]MCX7543382.1 N-6 DNA methylase [Corynebacterium marambiense]